jgi:hypothetical protein
MKKQKNDQSWSEIGEDPKGPATSIHKDMSVM